MMLQAQLNSVSSLHTKLPLPPVDSSRTRPDLQKARNMRGIVGMEFIVEREKFKYLCETIPRSGVKLVQHDFSFVQTFQVPGMPLIPHTSMYILFWS